MDSVARMERHENMNDENRSTDPEAKGSLRGLLIFVGAMVLMGILLVSMNLTGGGG